MQLYGPSYATRLLSSFAKLFTFFLQQEGFTLGTHDILVTERADRARTRIVRESRRIGNEVALSAIESNASKDDVSEDDVSRKLECEHATNPKFRAIIDRQYKQALDSYTNEINK